MIMKVQLKATGLFSIHDSFVLPSSHPISEAENSYFFVGVDSWHFPFSSFSYLTLQADLMTCCYQNCYHLLPSPWLHHPPLHFAAALAHMHFWKPVRFIKPPCPFFLLVFSHFIGETHLLQSLTEVGQAAETAQSFLGRERILNFHQQRAGNVAHCTSKKHREPAEQPGNTGTLPHVHSLKPAQLKALGSIHADSAPRESLHQTHQLICSGSILQRQSGKNCTLPPALLQPSAKCNPAGCKAAAGECRETDRHQI